jgi:DNA-binding response OmpR family regulator
MEAARYPEPANRRLGKLKVRRLSVSKVLIVDDDHTTVSLLRTLLELDGFDVRSAANSKTALATAKEFHPDAFLIDFHLSDCDGTDFIRRVRKEAAFARTPIVMASGSEREDEALEAGADDFLTKPFDPSLLVETLNRLLQASTTPPGGKQGGQDSAQAAPPADRASQPKGDAADKGEKKDNKKNRRFL